MTSSDPLRSRQSSLAFLSSVALASILKCTFTAGFDDWPVQRDSYLPHFPPTAGNEFSAIRVFPLERLEFRSFAFYAFAEAHTEDISDSLSADHSA